MTFIENTTANQEVLCRLKDISKRFGGVLAVDNVNFDLYAGEVHALMGENGAGKSTLMKILHGLHSETSGQVEVLGKRQHFNSPHDAENAGIAMVPQEIDLFPELTVAENLYVGRQRPRKKWGTFDWKEIQSQAKQIFNSLGVDIDVTDQVKNMSAAICQLIEIGRALIRNAKIIILDEPTAALTDRETERLFQTIQDLKRNGIGIVYISHRIEEIFQIADRITVMRDGKHVITDSIDNFNPEKLVQYMVGRPLSQLFTRSKRQCGDVVLEVKNLSSGRCFSNVSIKVKAGEIVGLAGLIGAGRTELAQAIFGVLPVTTGEIIVNGEKRDIRVPDDAISSGIAYLPEERRSQGLILPLKIYRNITLSSLKSLTKFGFIQYKKEDIIAKGFSGKLDIRGATLDSPVSQLSGGNQQKVVVAKILAREPSILLLDEPTRGIDIGAKSEIYKLIDKLAQEGKAVLLISSELPEVLSMCDRVYVMREGDVVSEFGQDEMTQENIGAAAAGVKLNHCAEQGRG